MLLQPISEEIFIYFKLAKHGLKGGERRNGAGSSDLANLASSKASKGRKGKEGKALVGQAARGKETLMFNKSTDKIRKSLFNDLLTAIGFNKLKVL